MVLMEGCQRLPLNRSRKPPKVGGVGGAAGEDAAVCRWLGGDEFESATGEGTGDSTAVMRSSWPEGTLSHSIIVE